MSFRIFKITFKVEMNPEKVDYIQKNENDCNFCSIAYFIYYRL